LERVHCSALENRSEKGKSSGARGGEATLTELIDCAVNVRKSFAFLRSHPLGFHLFCFIQFSSFSVPVSLFVRFSVPASLLPFPLVQINQREINNSNASPSRIFAKMGKSIRCNGLDTPGQAH
jgi:hypothetical protein